MSTVHTESEPITAQSLCRQIDTINATAMNLIEKLQGERDRYRNALESIASGAACLPGYSISDAAQEASAALSDETKVNP